MIDGRADLSGGSVNQSQANIAGRILDAVKIARYAAVWREQHNATGVSEDVVLLVEGVAEIRGRGQRVDRIFFSSQEMPASNGFRTAVLRHSRSLFLSGHVRSLARVKADEHD